jgi:hypothetical protein
MPICYKVVEFEYRDTDVLPVLRVVCTISPPATSLRRAIRCTFPGIQLAEPGRGLLSMLSEEEEIGVGGVVPPKTEMERLLAVLTATLTVRDTCDISHCLDFYRYPVETAETPEEWPYTAVGQALYRAKYWGDESEARRVQRQLVDFAVGHPALARSGAVAAVPRSGEHGNRPDWPPIWVEAVADAIGARVVALRRTRNTRAQKGIDDRDERARNQRGSMEADPAVRGETVLVVDDLYMQGDTLQEAVRALRQGGAIGVFGLCVAKTVKGCQGYPF